MRHGKYNAKKTTVDNIAFASKKEALYYAQLKMLEKAGRISHLELQPRYEMPPLEFTPDHGSICTYVADFRYLDSEGKLQVVDVKGMRTPVFNLKLKLMRYFYPNVEVILA